MAGPRRLWEDSHQTSAVIQDRVHLPGRIQLIAGGRYDSLRDHNYSLVETAPCVPNVPSNTPGAAGDPCATTYDASDNPIYNVPNSPTFTDKSVWLPQYAITFNPIANLTLYSNYGEVLSLGPQAPFWTDNGSQFLSPFNTRQAEVGAKYEPGQRILLTTAFFHMRAPFFYPESDGAGGLIFVSQGRETHNGVELNAQGKAANWLRLNASAAAMNATSTGTGTPAYDSKQVINVPHLDTSLFADVTVRCVRGPCTSMGVRGLCACRLERTGRGRDDEFVEVCVGGQSYGGDDGLGDGLRRDHAAARRGGARTASRFQCRWLREKRYDSDLTRTEFLAQRLGEGEQTALGGVIGGHSGKAVRAAMLRLLTMTLPLPRCGSRDWVTRKVPWRLVSMTWRQAA